MIGANPILLAEPPGFQSSFGNAVSGDGSVIVGTAMTSSGIGQGFRWTAAGGMVLIPLLPGDTGGSAWDVNADGNKITGTSGNGAAFLWSSGTLTNIGAPISNELAHGRAISGDGNTVAGTASSSGVWTWSSGTPHVVATALSGLGVDLGGWVLSDVVDVSANGKVLVGVGFHNGNDEGWIAILP